VSILADAGYDFVLFDTQHSPWEIKQLQPSIQAMRGKQGAAGARRREPGLSDLLRA
jgi:2-keto-3-deoxy-L-rhamnonate aldolase RhmA